MVQPTLNHFRTAAEVPWAPLGISAAETVPQLQQDCFKELVNKFAWAIGSTYRQSYSGTRSNARIVARGLASQFVREHGYPRAIAK